MDQLAIHILSIHITLHALHYREFVKTMVHTAETQKYQAKFNLSL